MSITDAPPTAEATELLAVIGTELVRIIDQVDPALWDRMPARVQHAIDAYHAATAAQDAQFEHNESLMFGGYAEALIADPIVDAAESLLALHESEPIR